MIKRENNTVFAGFCILILIFAGIAACATPDPGTNNSPAAPALPVQTSAVTSLNATAQSIKTVTIPSVTISGSASDAVPFVQPAEAVIRKQMADQQQDGPVSLTVNSARKQLGLGEWGKVYTEPMAGNVFLVLNITVKNTGSPEGFVFTNRSIVVRDTEHGTFSNQSFRLRQSLRKYVENPFTLPATVKMGDSVTGQLLFEMNDTATYRVILIGDNKTELAFRPVSFDNLMTTSDPVDITIHSATLLSEFNASMPHPVSPMGGHLFLVLNVTVKNNGMKEGFVFDFTSTTLKDARSGYYLSHSFNNAVNVIKNLKKPIAVPATIRQNGSITGQLLFSMPKTTEYRLNLIGDNKTIIASRMVYPG